MLDHDGVFTLHLEEGWKVTSGSGPPTYELLHPDKDGAVHISVYDRQPAPITASEAQIAMKRFLDSIKPTGEVEVRVLPENDSQCRAVAKCSTTNSADGKDYDWVVFLIFWKKNFLLCTCNAPPGSTMVDETEMLFASIAPVEERVGFLRRRRR